MKPVNSKTSLLLHSLFSVCMKINRDALNAWCFDISQPPSYTLGPLREGHAGAKVKAGASTPQILSWPKMLEKWGRGVGLPLF